MIAKVSHKSKMFNVDLQEPLDISIPLRNSDDNPKAWYVSNPIIEPVKSESFVGSVELGGSVNFRSIFFNPHGHGTHTECVGHITKEVHSINMALRQFHSIARVITLEPIRIEKDMNSFRKKGDQVIFKEQIEPHLHDDIESLVVRTLPNTPDKLIRQYSNTNFPYFDQEALSLLCEKNIKHLLVDLPSVDREEDGGQLLAHHAFWNVPQKPRMDATITEFIYVSQEIKDGMYLLNLQIAPFVNDATPSKPVLYKFID